MTLEKKINKKGEVSYLARIYLGEDETGKPIRASKSFKPTLTETGKVRTEKSAIEEVTALAQEWERGVIGGDIDPLKKTLTIADIFLEWKSTHFEALAHKTASEYEKRWNRAKPFIGHIKADNITIQHIDVMYKKLSKSNLRTGGSFNVESLHRTLASMFNWAIVRKYLKTNPTEGADRPKITKTRQTFLEPNQVLTLLSNLDSQTLEFQCWLTLLIITGCRRGEVVALKWSDISADGILTIQRACSYVAGHPLQIKGTKTDEPRRIALTNAALQLLRDYKDEHDIITASYGDLYEEQGFIFTQTSGMCRHPDSLKILFKQYLRYCGFSEDAIKKIHLHTIRHSTASLLIASNTDVRTIAGLLGHAQTSTTVNIYSHFLSSKVDASKTLFESLTEQAQIAR